ncbi:MAG: P-type conjugative transfer protein VirB9 [Rickettsiaceae bacterium]|nr:P-type conjugative transfer protein VirB9 [Rickettsiaceae bacterium]
MRKIKNNIKAKILTFFMYFASPNNYVKSLSYMHINTITKIFNIAFKNLIICIITIGCLSSSAIRESRPTAIDSRIRVIVYSPDDVFKYIGYYGYQATIELAKDESVVSISMGDTTSWQIVPAGHRIFIKPIDADATTNMTLITNKRTYFFELYAEEVSDMRDPDMVFNVRFIYPDDDTEDNIKSYHATIEKTDLSHPEKFNFNYSISGHEEIAPIKIYDDGEFTYLEFRGKNAQIPAVLAVDDYMHESIVNTRISSNVPNLVIVDHVFKKLTLRLEKRLVCVYNESFIDYEKEVKNARKKRGSFFY